MNTDKHRTHSITTPGCVAYVNVSACLPTMTLSKREREGCLCLAYAKHRHTVSLAAVAGSNMVHAGWFTPCLAAWVGNDYRLGVCRGIKSLIIIIFKSYLEQIWDRACCVVVGRRGLSVRFLWHFGEFYWLALAVYCLGVQVQYTGYTILIRILYLNSQVCN